MSFSAKGEDAEALVDTITIDASALTASNLDGLPDFQTLSDITLDTEMETDETQEEIEHEEEVVQTELGAEEVEIETETDNITEESSDSKKATIVPPLRPLTIAPKPAKVPVTMKPITSSQQVLLLQGSGSGQAIKLVSSQGQELNFANFSVTRPVSIKPAIKNLGNISIVQPKQVVMKKIVTQNQKSVQKSQTKQGGQIMVMQKADQQAIKIENKPGQIMFVQKTEQPHSVKLIPGTNVTTVPSPTKTITLQQAQEMGLLTGAKIVQQGGPTQKHTVLLNKGQQKAIKIVPQVNAVTQAGAKAISLGQLKSPTKILPATSVAAGKGQQRIIFKATGGAQTVLPPGQILQLAGNQAINSGQLHHLSIPGKGMQYIKFLTASSAETLVSNTNTSKTTAAQSHVVLSEVKPTSTSIMTPKSIKPVPTKVNVATGGQLMVIPSTYALSQGHQVPKVPIPMRHNSSHTTATATKATDTSTPPNSTDPNLDANGIRPRKPCNCTKSQCLKLYCDCFANGEFCYMCNCMNCFNNLENEDHRQRAIKACLERNPHAFRPKIGKSKDTTGELAVRKHTKGCNCKRSGCLKNYCECYEAKIACSNNCKCVGCRNIEDTMEKKNLRISNSIDYCIVSPTPARKIVMKEVGAFRPRRMSTSGKQPINFITEDVIEATCQCLLTISDSAESNMQDEELTKQEIIEEFGRCLTEIIECSTGRHLN